MTSRPNSWMAVLGLLFYLLYTGNTSAQSVTLSRTSLSYGNQVVATTSSTMTVTLTNPDSITPLAISGITASGDYSESDDCNGSLSPGGNCVLSVTFTPTVAGTVTGAITLNDDANNSPQLITTTGKGILPVSVTPASLTFGTIVVGSTSPAQTVTLVNQSSTTVTISLTTTGDYAAVGSGAKPCGSSLASKVSCTIAVTFAPKTSGSINGTVAVTYNAGFSPAWIALSGTGSGGSTPPLSFTPASLSFGNTVVGTSSKKQVIVVNNSTQTVTVSSLPASPDFTAAGTGTTPCGKPMPPSSPCTVTVTFSPTVTGTINGAVTVNDDAPIDTQILNLSGKGLAPVTLLPASLTFTAQLGTTSPAQTATLTNHQRTALTINSITPSGDYGTTSSTTPCGTSLAAGQSCTIGLTFIPDAIGGKMLGALTVRHNASDSPLLIKLTGTATGVLPRFAYVTNSVDNTISQYTVNATTGQLRSNGYVFAGTGPSSVAVLPSGKFAYVANGNSNNVSAYTVNASSGTLTPVAGSPFAAGLFPSSVTVHPSGKFAYVANLNSNDISGYTVNATTGALTPMGSTFLSGQAPTSLTVDPSGKFAYVANSNDSPGTVSAYTIDATTGALTAVAGSPFPSQGNAISSVTLTPSGKFAYVTNNEGNIGAFTINATTGALTPIAGSPFSTGSTQPFSVTVDPSGKFAYVGNVGSISVYTINATTGALAVEGSPLTVGTSIIVALTVDPTDQFLYVGNQGSNEIWTFAINGTSGALTFLKIVRTQRQPGSISFSTGTTPPTYTPRFAYAANYNSSEVSGYTINPGTGALTSLGPNVAAGTNPEAVTVDPSGSFAYVANFTSNDVSAYTINATTGILTSVGSNVAGGGHPLAVTVDPSGRFAYVANPDSNNTSAYAINPSTGALSLVGTVTTTSTSLTADPSGRFVLGVSGFTIYNFAINSTTGALTLVGSATASIGAFSGTVDPSGRFAYVTNNVFDDISIYAIDASTGALTSVGLNVSAGSNPYSIAIDPSGRFAYVANQDSNDVSAYTINPSTGALTSLGSTTPTPLTPYCVTVDPSGRFVYVAGFLNTVSAYTVNPSTGALTSVGTVLSETEPLSVATAGEIH